MTRGANRSMISTTFRVQNASNGSRTVAGVDARLRAREACGAALRQQDAEYIEQHPAEALARYYTEVGAFRSWLDRNHLEFQEVEAMPPEEQTAVLHRYADEVPFRIQLPEPDVLPSRPSALMSRDSLHNCECGVCFERHPARHLVVLGADELAICRDCYDAAARFGQLSGGHPIHFDLEQLR
jgi:hypothetical protein